MRQIRYELMRPQEIVAARERAPVAYVPIGPMEWHGPHMAVGMDMLHAHAMALEAAQKAGGVVLPPFPLGTETFTDPDRLRHRGFTGNERIYGMDYPGFTLPSLYIEESAFGLIIREVIRGLKRQAFRVIVLVNGHGAANHRATLTRIVTEESEPGEVTVLLTGYLYDTRYRGHAELGETSFLMAYHPDTVDLTTLPPPSTPLDYRRFGILDKPTVAGEPTPGFVVCPEQDPRRATADQGREDVAHESSHIAEKVREALAAFDGG
jgi:creatinine amidohydrolase